MWITTLAPWHTLCFCSSTHHILLVHLEHRNTLPPLAFSPLQGRPHTTNLCANATPCQRWGSWTKMAPSSFLERVQCFLLEGAKVISSPGIDQGALLDQCTPGASSSSLSQSLPDTWARFSGVISQDWGWQGPLGPLGPTAALAVTPRAGCPGLCSDRF